MLVGLIRRLIVFVFFGIYEESRAINRFEIGLKMDL